MENMKLLEARQNEIVEEFSMFGDWMEKYEHIIEMGKELNPLVESDKTEDNLIRGVKAGFGLPHEKKKTEPCFSLPTATRLSQRGWLH
jgi:cysteine desulfuration protein SufE